MKNVLIIGATSTIGSQLVKQLGSEYQLYITGRSDEKLSGLSEQENVHRVIKLNLSDDEVEKVLEDLPELDAVVYCVGVTDHTPVKFIKEKHLEKVFQANYFGAVSVTSILLRNKKIKSSSSLVYLSSTATQYPYFGGALYISSKLALEGFVKTLAVELSSKKVRVNAVSPVFVRSEMAESVNQFSSDNALEDFSKKHPFGMIETEEVAKTIEFLISPMASAITGQVINVGNFNAGLNQ